MKLILGSTSRWRKQVLQDAGYEFTSMSSAIDEKAIRCSDPEELAITLAKEKAKALLQHITEPAILITADQVVEWNGAIREKPVDEQEARHFLETLHLHPSRIISAVAVTNTVTKKQVAGTDIAELSTRKLPDSITEELIKEGSLFHCAGGLQTEHPLVAKHIIQITGSLDSHQGMPLELTKRLLGIINNCK